MDIFQQLGHLCRFSRADRNNLIDSLFIERSTDFQARRRVTTDYFRDSAGFKVGLPGSSRSGE